MPEAAMRTIATERLALEPQVEAHANEMFAVLADPTLYEHENEPPPSLEWLRERFARLESRQSPDGRRQWLNWVIRLNLAEAIGYVQATVHEDGRAEIAYVLSSRHWGRGLASEAVRAMIGELVVRHGVRMLSAVLKRENSRSMRLLERLGFRPAASGPAAEVRVEKGELLMQRDARDS